LIKPGFSPWETILTQGATAHSTLTTTITTTWIAAGANTINGSTFTLTKPDGLHTDTNPDAVSGTVAYDPTSNKATLTPNANLDYSTSYTATVKGGANGVKDAASNPLSANEVWTFTTQALSAPSNLSATRNGSLSNHRIDLTWTDNFSSEANLVIYQRAANTRSYSDRRLQRKTIYYYRVIAVDSKGIRSAPSNVASATTK
jgi:Bacterial Ig-like domain